MASSMRLANQLHCEPEPWPVATPTFI
jgi:hypothetical protein